MADIGGTVSVGQRIWLQNGNEHETCAVFQRPSRSGVNSDLSSKYSDLSFFCATSKFSPQTNIRPPTTQ